MKAVQMNVRHWDHLSRCSLTNDQKLMVLKPVALLTQCQIQLTDYQTYSSYSIPDNKKKAVDVIISLVKFHSVNIPFIAQHFRDSSDSQTTAKRVNSTKSFGLYFTEGPLCPVRAGVPHPKVFCIQRRP